MKQTSETMVGIFLLAGIGLICALIIFYGQMGDYFTPTYQFTVDFPDASQLIKGSDVYLSGAVIGKVLDDPRPVQGKHHVEVDIKIRKDIRLRKAGLDAHGVLEKGDEFVVGSSGLLGDRFVDVKPYEYPDDAKEEDKAPYILDHDHIQGEQTADISSLAASAQPLVDNANLIAEKLKKTLDNLNDHLLTDQTTSDLKETLANLKETIKKANVAADHADALIQHSDAVAQSAGEYIDKLKNGNGLLNELATDPKLAHNVVDLIQNLKEHGVLWYSDTAEDKDKTANKTQLKK